MDGTCDSCTATPPGGIVYWVDGQRLICRPWAGEYDDVDRPVGADGQLHMPGERICGHSDCVVASHIMALEQAA